MAESVTVKFATYDPNVEYVWVAEFPDAVPPSPKLML